MQHRRVAGRLGLLLHLVPGGVGRLANLGVELALLELGVALGHLLLLGEDRLVPLGLGERPAAADFAFAASISAWMRGLLEGQVPVRLGDRLLGEQPLLLGLLPGPRLGDGRVLEHPGGLGPAQVLQVGALGEDVLELEGVQHQTLVGHRVLGLLGDRAGERRPVPDDLLDGEPADDRAQRAGQHLPGEVVDLVLLVQEPLGGGPDRVLGAADLDDRHALQVGAGCPACSPRPGCSTSMPPAGQVEGLCSFCTTGRTKTEAPSTTFCPDMSVDRPPSAASRGAALAAGDDERLVGPGDLDPGEHEQHQDEQRGRIAMSTVPGSCRSSPRVDGLSGTGGGLVCRVGASPSRCEGVEGWHGQVRSAGPLTTTLVSLQRLHDEDLGAERDRPVRPGAELDRLAGEAYPDLAVPVRGSG